MGYCVTPCGIVERIERWKKGDISNWTSFASGAGARVTAWTYDPYHGCLAAKTYDGGATGPSYTYTDAGRLLTRAWARGITTTYGYDYAGQLTSISYSDNGVTPGITYTLDRLGRQTGIVLLRQACVTGIRPGR